MLRALYKLGHRSAAATLGVWLVAVPSGLCPHSLVSGARTSSAEAAAFDGPDCCASPKGCCGQVARADTGLEATIDSDRDSQSDSGGCCSGGPCTSCFCSCCVRVPLTVETAHDSFDLIPSYRATLVAGTAPTNADLPGVFHPPRA